MTFDEQAATLDRNGIVKSLASCEAQSTEIVVAEHHRRSLKQPDDKTEEGGLRFEDLVPTSHETMWLALGLWVGVSAGEEDLCERHD